MSFSRPFQWYQSHAEPFWPDGTFKGKINPHVEAFFSCHLSASTVCSWSATLHIAPLADAAILIPAPKWKVSRDGQAMPHLHQLPRSIADVLQLTPPRPS